MPSFNAFNPVYGISARAGGTMAPAAMAPKPTTPALVPLPTPASDPAEITAAPSQGDATVCQPACAPPPPCGFTFASCACTPAAPEAGSPVARAVAAWGVPFPMLPMPSALTRTSRGCLLSTLVATAAGFILVACAAAAAASADIKGCTPAPAA